MRNIVITKPTFLGDESLEPGRVLSVEAHVAIEFISAGKAEFAPDKVHQVPAEEPAKPAPAKKTAKKAAKVETRDPEPETRDPES